jgi:hypothetical protein
MPWVHKAEKKQVTPELHDPVDQLVTRRKLPDHDARCGQTARQAALHQARAPESVFRINPRAEFVGSLHSTSFACWDHEPRDRSADLRSGAIGARGTAPSWSSALLVMRISLAAPGARIRRRDPIQSDL